MLEYFFQCPYCGETISMLLDTSVNKQVYIEDCEVCCNPIQVSTHSIRNQLIEFKVESIEQ